MGLLPKKLGNFPRVLIVIVLSSFVLWECLAAPSSNFRNSSQNHDAAATPDAPSSTRASLEAGRRRFILRRATAAPAPGGSRTRKRHLQPPSATPTSIDLHFQPLQRGVPRDDILPFLEFGQKLSAATTTNSIADLKHSTTVTPNRSFSRIIINIERPTSPNSLLLNKNSPTLPPIRETITIISQPQNTPVTSSLIPISNSPATSAIRLIRPQSTSLPPSISQSDDAFNDIMANSHRRRRKKLVARRLQLNATEVITEHVMNDTVMNAALVRRKSLLQPQRNVSAQQTVLRRPLMRITQSPSAKYTTAVNITDSIPLETTLSTVELNNSENKTTSIISDLLTSLRPSFNYSRSLTIQDILQENVRGTTLSTNGSNVDLSKAATANHNSEVTTAVSSGYDSALTNAERQRAVTRSSRNVTLSSPPAQGGAASRSRGGGQFRNETTTIPSTSVATQRTEPNRSNHTDSLNNNRNTATIILTSTVPTTSLNINNHKLDDDDAKPPSIDGLYNNNNNFSGVQNTTTEDKRITFDPIITSRNITSSILQTSNNRALINNTQSESSTLTPIINESTISRIEISTSTVSSSTTSIPFYYRNNNATNYNNPSYQNSTVLRIPLKIPASVPNNTRYNLESTTRRAWRPVSTMRPMERSTSTTPPPTTLPPVSTTSLRPPVPKSTENRASETTFGADSQPSAEFTVRPNLGSPRDAADPDDGPSISVATYALLSLAFVTAIGVASYGARHLANRRRRMLDESDSSASESSSVAGATLKRGPPPPNSPEDSGGLPRITLGWGDKAGGMASLAPSPAPPHPQWHFPRHKLRLQTVLGQGNFGQVWKAEAEDICNLEGTRLVAVKSTKAGAGERERADLLRELAIMQQLGAHPNVVTLLGCCTEQEPHLLIMEYVMYGKLLTFLRDHRTRRDFLQFSSSDDDGGEQALTARDLTHFAYCVAKGMDYLVSRGIIHRDLAARNVLVDHNKQCKIADFGMSRHARDSSGQVYEPRQKGALPIRWMAPESLVRSVFTHRTDVWSFGILMWEIVTLGSTPYPTMGAREVMRRVREGYRLERPPHCRPELFRVVASCWLADPSRRPDFGELRAELRRLRDEGAAWPGGGHVDLQSALPPPSPSPNTAPSTAAPTPSDPGGM